MPTTATPPAAPPGADPTDLAGRLERLRAHVAERVAWARGLGLGDDCLPGLSVIVSLDVLAHLLAELDALRRQLAQATAAGVQIAGAALDAPRLGG